jgi:hypothetical protein
MEGLIEPHIANPKQKCTVLKRNSIPSHQALEDSPSQLSRSHLLSLKLLLEKIPPEMYAAVCYY